MHPPIPGLVSTIIPVHNRPALLPEAVGSVLAQTYRPLEIIIVDDGSTDHTLDITHQLATQNPREIQVLTQPNAGPGLARETGRQQARGEFIQYLDSDDLLLPRKFEWQVAGLRQHVECGVAYGKTAFQSSSGPADNLPWKRTGEAIAQMFPSFLSSRWWGTSTPLYRRAICDAAGPWLALLNEEDWEYDCRIASQGVQLCFIDEFVSLERDHTGPRLSRGGSVERKKLRDRAKAQALILQHARRAGIGESRPEMQQFARALFLLARQCGAAGLGEESRMLFRLAQDASGKKRARSLDFQLYDWAARVLGWQLAGKIACTADRLRP